MDLAGLLGGRRLPWTLFGAAFAVRMLAVLLLVLVDAQPVFDEDHYVRRAVGWAAHWGLVEPPPPIEAWDAAYADGFQPPLHPQAMGAVTTGRRLPLSGRVWNALLGALATPLLFRFARRLVTRRAAAAAAWIHAGHPTLVFFGASLWAEPLFVLLMLGAADAAFAARAAPSGRPRLLRAAAAGLCLGGLLLTRTAALPWLVALPLAMMGKPRCWPGRRLAAGTIVAVALLATVPWQATLQKEEGSFSLLATSSGLNLAFGNTHLVPPGHGSLWLGPAAHGELLDEIDAFAAERGLDPDRAAGAYARDQALRDPAGTLRRTLERLRLLLAADLFPVRHVAHVVTAPGPWWQGAGVWGATTLAWFVVAAYVLKGLLRSGVVRHRGALLLLAGSLALGPLATVAFPRLHLPVLALLLPAAGAGWAARREPLSLRRRTAVAGAMGVVAWLTMSSLPAVLESQLLPSAWARPWVGPVARLAGAEVRYADQVWLRHPEPIPGGVLRIDANDERVVDESLDEPGDVVVSLFAGAPGERRRLVLQLLPDGPQVILDPVRPEHRLRWTPLDDHGLPGIEMQWLGGSFPVTQDAWEVLER